MEVREASGGGGGRGRIWYDAQGTRHGIGRLQVAVPVAPVEAHSRGVEQLDGIYGIRFAHNTDATVAGLTLTKE